MNLSKEILWLLDLKSCLRLPGFGLSSVKSINSENACYDGEKIAAQNQINKTLNHTSTYISNPKKFKYHLF